MILRFLSLSVLLATTSHAQTSEEPSDIIILSGINPLAVGSFIPNLGGDILPTGADVSYLTYSTRRVISGATILLATSFAEANGSLLFPSSITPSTSTSYSILQGWIGRSSISLGNSTLNFTASRTASSTPAATNTQPCNNHLEFYERSYSNITFIAAHHSPFVNPNNAAAN